MRVIPWEYKPQLNQCSLVHAIIYEVIKEQEGIGWDHAMRGRLSSKWTKPQRLDNEQQDYTFPHKNWAVALIGQLWVGMKEIWIERNKSLYCTTPEERLAKNKLALRPQVTYYHQNKQKHLSQHNIQRLFHQTVE